MDRLDRYEHLMPVRQKPGPLTAVPWLLVVLVFVGFYRVTNAPAVSDISVGYPPVYQTSTSVRTTSASVTTSSVQLVPANPRRRAFYIWNNSGNSAYITFGTTSASASPTFIMATFTTLQQNAPVVWTGPISAIRNSGSGTLTVTELE